MATYGYDITWTFVDGFEPPKKDIEALIRRIRGVDVLTEWWASPEGRVCLRVIDVDQADRMVDEVETLAAWCRVFRAELNLDYPRRIRGASLALRDLSFPVEATLPPVRHPRQLGVGAAGITLVGVLELLMGRGVPWPG